MSVGKEKNSIRTNKKRRPMAALGLFFIIFSMTATILTIMFLSRNLKEQNLDPRSEAMVDAGLAEINTYPFDQSTLKVGEVQNVQLQINSKDKAVDAIELRFEIIADTGLLDNQSIQFTDDAPAGLEINKKEIVESDCSKDCYTATLILTSQDSNQPFSSHDQFVTVSSLNFKAIKEGNLEVKISQDSQVVDSATNQDILDKPSVLDFQYFVTANGIDPAQCNYVYSDWSSCVNNWQTREYSVEPSGCHWYEDAVLEELSRSCNSGNSNIISADSNSFYIYPIANCWYSPDDGSGLYIIWDKVKYPGVTWIDMSTDPTFASYYHKSVEGNIDQSSGNFLMVSGKNFISSSNSGGSVIFEANKQYFFRMTTNQGKQIMSARFYTTICSGADKLYRSCNESCGAASDDPNKACAEGLTCFEGSCRREGNPSDSLCLPIVNSSGALEINSSCNQYCSDNNECSAGLSCYWNRCRLPSNLENTSCQAVTNTTSYQSRTVRTSLLPSEAYDLETYACNHGCNSNRDCNSNLRCYQGQCRLAVDPEDNSCGSGAAPGSKGEVVEVEPDATSAAISTITPGQTIQISPVFKETKETVSANETFLTKILNSFNWQWLAIAGALLVAAIAFMVLGIANSKKDPWQNPKNRPQVTPAPVTKKPEATLIEKEIPKQAVKIQPVAGIEPENTVQKQENSSLPGPKLPSQ